MCVPADLIVALVDLQFKENPQPRAGFKCEGFETLLALGKLFSPGKGFRDGSWLSKTVRSVEETA